MSSRNPKHIHKYFKADMSFGKVWACALPNCNHHMPPHMLDLLQGKYTICWKCDGRTQLDIRTFKMDKPLCEDCDPNFVAIDDPDILEKLRLAGLINTGDK